MKIVFSFVVGFAIASLFGYFFYIFKPVQVREVQTVKTVYEDYSKSEIYESALNQAVEYIRSLPQEEIRYLICN